MRKRIDNRGETIVEALLSVVVISLGMLILSGALVTSAGNAAKAGEIVSSGGGAVTKITLEDGKSFQATVNETTGNIEIKAATKPDSGNENSDDSIKITVYKTGTENMPLYYYRYEESGDSAESGDSNGGG